MLHAVGQAKGIISSLGLVERGTAVLLTIPSHTLGLKASSLFSYLGNNPLPEQTNL